MQIELTAGEAQDFLNWLHGHEKDIQNDINDFGELRKVFRALFEREAGDKEEDALPW